MKNKIIIILCALVAAGGLMLVVSKKQNAGPGEETPTENVSAQTLYDEALQSQADGDSLKAKEAYEKILQDFPDFERVEAIQAHLSDLNLEIIFSNAQTPQTVLHDVQPGDSLGKLAKQYNTTVDLIKKSNNINQDVIRVGQKLRIWTAPFNIFVDKSQNSLILKSGDEVIKVYAVSTGINNSTPVGTFKITTKLTDPVWFKSGAIIPPESSENVLGSRWMGFDLAGYGIHGTTEPDKIGQQATAGCVRMLNKDVEEIFTLVPAGTQVTIVD